MSNERNHPGAPSSRRRRAGWGLLVLAGVLYLIALLLPVDNGGRIPGWEALVFVARHAVEDFRSDLFTTVRLAILQANVSAGIAALALVLGGRTLARVVAGIVVVVAWGVSAAIAWTSADPFGEFVKLLQNGPGTLAWYASLTALAAAAFVWPRRGGGEDEPTETDKD